MRSNTFARRAASSSGEKSHRIRVESVAVVGVITALYFTLHTMSSLRRIPNTGVRSPGRRIPLRSPGGTAPARDAGCGIRNSDHEDGGVHRAGPEGPDPCRLRLAGEADACDALKAL